MTYRGKCPHTLYAREIRRRKRAEQAKARAEAEAEAAKDTNAELLTIVGEASGMYTREREARRKAQARLEKAIRSEEARRKRVWQQVAALLALLAAGALVVLMVSAPSVIQQIGAGVLLMVWAGWLIAAPLVDGRRRK